jgi:8-oxo-dGTP diphosphatase
MLGLPELRTNPMSHPQFIVKIGLAVVDGARLMTVRKKGHHQFILPGGKPEPGEEDISTIEREIREELECGVDRHSIAFLGEFTDRAAELDGVTVVVRLYVGKLVGTPEASAEIAEIGWLELNRPNGFTLAPSLTNQIVPFLSSRLSGCQA